MSETGAERYLRKRLEDPEYRATYERIRAEMDEVLVGLDRHHEVDCPECGSERPE